MNAKQLLDAQDLEPKKSLGQNFLHDPRALTKIVEAAGVQPGETVLEVGPGTGALTRYLAQAAAHVICIEIDGRLIPILRDQFADRPQVQIVEADILKIDPAAAVEYEPYVVVANLPYYITSAILRHVLEQQHKPRRIVVTVQQEVAERVVAKPDDMSILAVSVQYYGTPKIVARIGSASFWPRPDVASAVLQIDVHPESHFDVPNDQAFFAVVRAGFGQKRKQLKNAMGAGLDITHQQAGEIITAAGVDPTRRAETLTLDEWAAVTRVAAAMGVTSTE